MRQSGRGVGSRLRATLALIVALVALLVVVFAVVPGAISTSHAREAKVVRSFKAPAWSPDGRRLMFTGNLARGDRQGLFVANANGSGLRRVGLAAFIGGYSWSPRRTGIAYSAGVFGGPLWIYLVGADGRRNRRLVRGTDPADGKQIAFATGFVNDYYDYELSAIDVIGPDGQNRSRITPLDYSYVPLWSRDGAQIAFERTVDEEGSIQLHVVRPDGTGLRPLTPGRSSDGASWSPDGRQVAFFSDGDRAYLANADGSNERRLPLFRNIRSLTWSPRSDALLFWRERARTLPLLPAAEIWLARVAGSHARKLTAGQSPVWSPTGRWIAFDGASNCLGAGGEVEHAIYRIRPNGTGRRRITPCR